jgi:hypothetical protein
MTTATTRMLVGAVLLIHGIGHFMGVLGVLDLFKVKGWNGHSWLLTPLMGVGASRTLGVVLFAAVLVGFLGVGFALFGWLVPHAWWRSLALVFAVISLVTLVLYWNALVLVFPNKIGALGVNVAVLVCLLWLNWPTEAALGY